MSSWRRSWCTATISSRRNSCHWRNNGTPLWRVRNLRSSLSKSCNSATSSCRKPTRNYARYVCACIRIYVPTYLVSVFGGLPVHKRARASFCTYCVGHDSVIHTQFILTWALCVYFCVCCLFNRVSVVWLASRKEVERWQRTWRELVRHVSLNKMSKLEHVQNFILFIDFLIFKFSGVRF